ncbi:MAG: XisI protein [Saprospiraceae bacterium]|nr:XisI protein [Saprospiraceae bacterium]
MDRIAFFREAIANTMKDYEAERTHSQSFIGLDFEQIFDVHHNRFQLVLIGWKEDERIYHLIFHLDIIDDKIWIQEDNTEDGVALLLEAQGVNKKDMVLAFYPAYHRVHTEYAVA